MRLHRFIGDFPIDQKIITVTDDALLQQWLNVLRLKEGDKLIISNGQGSEAKGKILSLSKNGSTLEVIEQYENDKEPPNVIFLYSSVLKRDNFEWLAQKSVECGVNSITPILTERTIKTNLQEARLQKIMHEAAEQSGRGLVPKLQSIVSFEMALIEVFKKTANVYICDVEAEKEKKPILPKNDKNTAAVFIGPEGGFTKEEISYALSNGAEKLSLGRSILRAETAAIVAVYKLAY